MTLTELQALRNDWNRVTTIKLLAEDVWFSEFEDECEKLVKIIDELDEKLYTKIYLEEFKILKQQKLWKQQQPKESTP